MRDFTYTVGILAGGRGSRQGGLDKGLLQIGNKALIEIILDQLQHLTDEVTPVEIIINANRNIEKYSQYGYKVISDELTNFQGPLAGFLCLLKNIQSKFLITLPCDAPKIPIEYFTKLRSVAQEEKQQITVAKDKDRLQPLYCCLSVELLTSLNDFLFSGQRKIDKWFENVGFVTCEFNCNDFTNINTVEQLRLARLKNTFN